MCSTSPIRTRWSAIRPAHRLYVRRLFDEGKVLLAGPFADGSGALFVYEAESLEAARAIAAEDPYSTGGAFADCRISEWSLLGIHPDLLQPAPDDAARLARALPVSAVSVAREVLPVGDPSSPSGRKNLVSRWRI